MSLQQLNQGSSFLWVEEPFAESVSALGWPRPGALAEALRMGRAGPSGRSATRILDVPGLGEALHLRPLRHGGILRLAWGDRLLSAARGRRELEVGAELLRLGAPVPTPVLLIGERNGPLCRAALGLLHVRDSVDAAEFLARDCGRNEMLRSARAAGRAVRRFHDAGGRHADLHVANLLLRPQIREVDALVIDLDRARVGSDPSPARRMRELMRLYRSLLKRDLLGAVGARGCVAFLSAYIDTDRSLRRSMLDHLDRERLRVALHSLGYRRFPKRRDGRRRNR